MSVQRISSIKSGSSSRYIKQKEYNMASFGHSLINREQYELVRLGLLTAKQPGRLHCSPEQLFFFSVKIQI